MTEASGITKKGKGGHHQAARRAGGAAPRVGHPPDCLVGPLDAPFAYIYPSG